MIRRADLPRPHRHRAARSRRFADSPDPAISHLARAGTMAGGLAWLGAARITSQVIQFILFVILARALTPDEFGLAAVVMVITSFAVLLTDLGLGSAVIQIEQPTRGDLSAAFWMNIGSGILLTAIFWLVSPFIADFYGNEELEGLVKLGGLLFALSNSAIHIAVLERSFRFRQLAAVEVAGTLSGAASSVSWAFMGGGEESLILGPVVAATVTTGILWLTVPWRPAHTFGGSNIKSIWIRSRGVAGFNLVNYWSRNADNILLSKAVPAVDLAFYSRAYGIMLAPVAQVNVILARVLLPSLTRIRSDPQALQREYIQTLRATCALLFPITCLIAVAAKPLIEVAFGPAWLPMAPILTLLAASGPPQIALGAAGVLYQVLERGDALLRRGLIVSLFTVMAIAGGLYWGAQGVAAAYLARCYLVLPTFMQPLRLAGISLGRCGRSLLGVSVATAAMAVAAVAVAAFSDWSGMPLLVSQTVVGTTVYLIFLWAAEPDLAAPVKDRLRPRRSKLGDTRVLTIEGEAAPRPSFRAEQHSRR